MDIVQQIHFMNEWMNEKYILLSFTTFVYENSDCHVVFQMQGYYVQYMSIRM